MSYLSKLRPGRLVPRVMHQALEVGEFAAYSYGFGYALNRWRDRASVRGVPADLLAGIVSKVVVLGADLFGAHGRMVRSVLPHVNTLGNAAVGAYFHTMGAGHGAQASGVKRLILPAGDVDRAKKAFPSATVLGAIPKAPHGDFLSAAELAEMARG